MKKSLFYILFVVSALYARAADTAFVKIRIEYSCDEAEAVNLVWGINNWNIPAVKLRPAGTVVKDKLLHTPMKKEEGVFYLQLELPANTTADFVFNVTQGPLNRKLDLWDINRQPQKDFHVVALSDNTTRIAPTINVRSAEQPGLLDFALEIFVFTGMLCATFFIARRYFFDRRKTTISGGVLILSSSISMSVIFSLARASTSGLGWDLYFSPLQTLPKVLYASYYDILFVVLFASVFALLFLLAKKRIRFCASLKYTFGALCFLFTSASILNIKVVETLGKPFTWQWLYYSDFLKSSDAKAALSANVSSSYISSVLIILASGFLLTVFLISFFQLFPVKSYKFRTAIAGVPLAVLPVYFIIAPEQICHLKCGKQKLENPVSAFLSSVNPFGKTPTLFTENFDEKYSDDFITKKKNEGTERIAAKNILLFVLESTAAEYVSGYSDKYGVTPELQKHLENAIVFKNIYAHAPATNNSMVSLLGSVYPWISYSSLTREFPEVKMQTITSHLKGKGYRTAFFNSADNRFQKAGEFLQHRCIDRITDCTEGECTKSFEIKEEPENFLSGKDDECTADEMVSWISSDTSKPFFAMMWTYQTHYPYFTSGKDYMYDTQDASFNKYLNAVKHSDMVLGNVMNALKAMKLDESTLVIVIGDHGEAFGRHNQLTHASNIYEENVHIPCIFIHPSFKQDAKENTGGIVDIAPTAMELLGYDIPAQWQGKSLFSREEKERVYFFTPWGDYQFGYREGDMKYIYNAMTNETQIYDLKIDPFETKNLSGNYPDKTAEIHGRLAAWVQYHSEYLQKNFGVK